MSIRPTSKFSTSSSHHYSVTPTLSSSNNISSTTFQRTANGNEINQTRSPLVKRLTPSPPRIPPPKPPPVTSNNNNVSSFSSSPTITNKESSGGIIKKGASLFMRPATVYAISSSSSSPSNNNNDHNTSPVKIPSSPTPPQVIHQVVVQQQQQQQQPKTRTSYSLKDFDLGITLGTGSFGRVKFAKYRNPMNNEESSQRVAIKMLKKKEVIRLNQVEHIVNEKTILFMLSSSNSNNTTTTNNNNKLQSPHPFVVKMFGTFMDDSYLYMILEFVRGGEFFTHLRNRGHLKNQEAQFYAASVASVFSYLHSFDIVYRDLKPENLLLDHQGYIKVTDFGFAKHIPDNKTFTLCGTPEYLAPEILLNQGHGKGVDWWALGVLVYEMLSGGAPFVHEDTMEVYQLIVRAQVIYPSYFDPDARSFLRRLLQPDVSKRYGCLVDGARDVLHHRWLNGIDYEALLKRIRPPLPPILPETKDIDDTSNFEFYSEDDQQQQPNSTCSSSNKDGEVNKNNTVNFDGFPGVVL
jgi:serine/threonine protein kinase